MVSVLDSGASCSGSSLSVVFLGKTLIVLLLLASVSETAHHSCQQGKESKILSDVRLKA